ncbi:hypothetical protein BGZ63DRAFT_400230 [Mariannaea sp. PMI_226]|nr:hypothetical protein BGZ63DRAFT_400230 [Mariannaea sp. PMI_226]
MALILLRPPLFVAREVHRFIGSSNQSINQSTNLLSRTNLLCTQAGGQAGRQADSAGTSSIALLPESAASCTYLPKGKGNEYSVLEMGMGPYLQYRQSTESRVERKEDRIALQYYDTADIVSLVCVQVAVAAASSTANQEMEALDDDDVQLTLVAVAKAVTKYGV